MFPSLTGIKLGGAAIILGALVLSLLSYRGLYHHEEAKLAAVQAQLGALQVGYANEVAAANACGQATAEAHAKLVEKQAILDEAGRGAVKAVGTAKARSTEMLHNIDPGKSCEKAVRDYISSWRSR